MSLTITPKKATSCGCPTCSGARSRACSSATHRRTCSAPFGLYGGFDEARGVDDIQATLKVLRALPQCNGKTGVLGFCLGGKLAYLAACRTDAQVSVAYYGVGIEKAIGEIDKVKGRLVMHVAELDKFCPPGAQAQIVARTRGRANVELYVYPGQDQGRTMPSLASVASISTNRRR